MNPLRHSQIERAIQVLDKSGTVDILKDDQHLLFLFKKTERIVAAMYVITGLFSDTEPLKWKLRDSGTVLLRCVLSINERSTVQSKESLSLIFAEIANIISLVDIAYVADLLSPMNFSVLKKELEVVHGIVEGRWRVGSSTTSSSTVDASFFGIAKDLFSGSDATKNRTASSPSIVTNSYSGKAILESITDFERFTNIQKDTNKGQTISTYRKSYAKSSVLNQRTNIVSGQLVSVSDTIKVARQKKVISILVDKKVATIRDFSSVINDCSEKTIQRLLIEMVHKGVLKREGDRRWSRYSVVV